MVTNTLGSALGVEPNSLPVSDKKPISLNAPESFGKEAKSYLQTIEPLIQKSAQAEGDFETMKAQQKAMEIGGMAKAQKTFGENVKGEMELAEQKELQYPRPEFHPTQENAASLGALFSLVSTIGMVVGASGKRSATNAMNAMTGMLKGWKEGRKDLYDKEVKEFDKEYKRITDVRNEIQKKLEKSIQLQTIDKDGANLAAQEAAALFGANSVGQNIINTKGVAKAIEYLNAGYNLDAQYKKIESDAKNRAEDRLLRLQQYELKYGGGVGGRGATKGLPDYFPGLSFSGTPSQNESKRESINSGALALVTAKELQEYAKEHPNQLGRQGQIQQNVDRYLKSWNAGKSFEEMADDGQPALIFAKRYAAYLVAYERSLAGSNKAMTVAFQNRFNKLMSQDQFNAKGFDDLMNEQMSEVAKATASKDPAITGSGLLKYGDDIIGRAKLPTTETGQKPIPTITTQAEFDALPEGSVYIEDDKKYTKPRKQK